MELFEAIRAADWLRVRAMAEAGAGVNARAEDGSTPLMMAAAMGHMPMVKILLAAGADVNAIAGNSDTAMLRAAKSGRRLVFVDLQHLTDPRVRELASKQLGRHPLGDWKRYDDRVPELAAAATEGRVDEVRRLLAAGLDIDSFDPRSHSEAIRIAAAAGNATGVRTLLDAGADPEVISLGSTSLMEAARSGSAEAVRLLLAAGADPNFSSFHGNITPLMAAVQHGHREAAELLLRAGADAHAKYAAAMLAQLGPAGAYPTEPRARLLSAAGRGQLDGIRAALDAGASPASRNPRGVAALTLAAKGGHLAAVDALLEAGAGADRYTLHLALVEAAGGGHLPVVRSLIRAGGAVDCQVGDWNTTPLCKAIGGGHPAMVSALIDEFGADINATARDPIAPSLEAPGSGTSPLVHATRKADPRIVRILKDAGATKVFGGLPLERLRGIQSFGDCERWLLVRAPIEEAARAYAAARGASTWERDVYGREVAITERCSILFQFRGHSWTLIRDWRCQDSRDKVNAAHARAISEHLGGRALFSGNSDTTDTVGYQLYESGRLLEKLDVADWLLEKLGVSCELVEARQSFLCMQELMREGLGYTQEREGVWFESRLREVDPLAIAPLEFVDAFFRAQEIFLPRLIELKHSQWQHAPGEMAAFRLTGLDADDFERVDFVSLPTSPQGGDQAGEVQAESWPMEASPKYDSDMTQDEIESIAEALGRPSDILSIRRVDAARFRVKTGFIAGPLCGMGRTFLVERAGEGWCVTDEGGWIS